MLNAPPLNETNVESGSKALLAEWLGLYFNGGQHTIGIDDALITFPKVSIEFDQGPARQPVSDGTSLAEIRIVTRSGHMTRGDHPVGHEVACDCHLQFYVRAAVIGGGEGNSNAMANRVADLLLAILNNPLETFSLARKGLAHLAPRKAEIQSSSEYKMRLIGCPCQLLWLVAFRE